MPVHAVRSAGGKIIGWQFGQSGKIYKTKAEAEAQERAIRASGWKEKQMAITSALNKIKDTLFEPTFYKVIQGGMSSGKTFGIMTLLTSYAQSYPDSKITVIGIFP